MQGSHSRKVCVQPTRVQREWFARLTDSERGMQARKVLCLLGPSHRLFDSAYCVVLDT